MIASEQKKPNTKARGEVREDSILNLNSITRIWCSTTPEGNLKLIWKRNYEKKKRK
jgi:hypothetical protein